MNKIGIIVADPNELIDLPWKVKNTQKINQFEFVIYENDVILVHSGIGIANAASATQELISSFNVETIWNYGAVGANKHLNVYDIVTPEKIYFHDVITPWYKRGQTPGEKEYYYNEITSEKNNNLASGSSFVIEKESIKNIKKDINCDIFDMETAAIAQIANKNNVKIKIVKCVSDSIGHTDPSKVENINIRIAKAGKMALNFMIDKINKK